MNATDTETRKALAEPGVIARLAREFADSKHLTPRELDVFLLILEGWKNSVIARKLGIADTTVRLHITGVHRKIGTGSKADLVIELLKWVVATRQMGKLGNDGRPRDAAE